jgi:hypothetical protein
MSEGGRSTGRLWSFWRPGEPAGTEAASPWRPSGPGGEAVIDLVASDAVAAGFGSIVLVLGPATGPAIRYHVDPHLARAVDVRFALQDAPLGTVHAVLSASDTWATRPMGWGTPTTSTAGPPPHCWPTHLRAPTRPMRWSGSAWPTPWSAPHRSPAASARSDPDGQLLGKSTNDARSPRTPTVGFVSADGREPSELSPDARVSMNLWGFTPAFHKTLQAAMEAATGRLRGVRGALPEVVAESLASSSFTVLPATGRCIGVTHPDDLSLVQAELARQVGQGTSGRLLWGLHALTARSNALPCAPHNRFAA